MKVRTPDEWFTWAQERCSESQVGEPICNEHMIEMIEAVRDEMLREVKLYATDIAAAQAQRSDEDLPRMTVAARRTPRATQGGSMTTEECWQEYADWEDEMGKVVDDFTGRLEWDERANLYAREGKLIAAIRAAAKAGKEGG